MISLSSNYFFWVARWNMTPWHAPHSIHFCYCPMPFFYSIGTKPTSVTTAVDQPPITQSDLMEHCGKYSHVTHTNQRHMVCKYIANIESMNTSNGCLRVGIPPRGSKWLIILCVARCQLHLSLDVYWFHIFLMPLWYSPSELWWYYLTVKDAVNNDRLSGPFKRKQGWREFTCLTPLTLEDVMLCLLNLYDFLCRHPACHELYIYQWFLGCWVDVVLLLVEEVQLNKIFHDRQLRLNRSMW